jgi:hypothetical protein
MSFKPSLIFNVLKPAGFCIAVLIASAATAKVLVELPPEPPERPTVNLINADGTPVMAGDKPIVVPAIVDPRGYPVFSL